MSNVLSDIISHSPRLRPNTKRAYQVALAEFLEFCSHRAAPFQPTKAWAGKARILTEKWRDHLIGSNVPNTINGKLAALRYISRRWSEREGKDPAFFFGSYAERLSGAGGSTRTRRALTRAQTDKLIAACQGDKPGDLRDMAIVMLFLYTGMRREGMAALRFVYPDTTVGVNGAMHLLTIVLKGGKYHQLPPLDPRAQQPLTRWLTWLTSHGGADGAPFCSLGQFVSGTCTIGGPLTGDGIHKILASRAKKAGIANVTPHQLRHTFITRMQEAGVAPDIIAGYTGQRIKASGDVPMLARYTDVGAMADLPTLRLP